jgi:hypothetical protein
MELQTHKDFEIRYTTDGSNPKTNGELYKEYFAMPTGIKFVQAVAVNESKGICSELLQYEVKEDKLIVDKEKPVRLFEPLMPTSTTETFRVLDNLKDLNSKIRGIDLTIQEKYGNGFMMLSLGEFDINNIEDLIKELNQLIDKFFINKKYEVTATINNVEFESGKVFEQWISKTGTTIDSYKNKITQ